MRPRPVPGHVRSLSAPSTQILADRASALWHAVRRAGHRRPRTRASGRARATGGRRPQPGPSEVLIKVAAAGVNRADLLQRQGHYQPPPGASAILGLEVSGTVAEVGAEVSNWAVGDPCVALLAGGGYADYVAAPAGQVVPPPPGVELVAAAGSSRSQQRSTPTSNWSALLMGDQFLVHGGAGGIGSFAIQYAKSLGATVIATAGSEDKLNYCRSIGADHAISYRDDWPAAVRAIAA